jgi:hypothetical protein
LSWLEFNFVLKIMWGKYCSFPHKTLWIATMSLYIGFFFLWFFLKLSLSILFFNIKLVENYNYKSLQIRLYYMGKHCSFHHKNTMNCYNVSSIVFLSLFFYVLFYFIFSKIISVDFIFLILSWLRI